MIRRALARLGLELRRTSGGGPRRTLAEVLTHVRGVGSYANGVEKPRVQVTLATQIPEDVCRAINLGYRDPRSINVADYQDREDEGILYVPKAGEMLYRLKNPPEWAQG